MKSLEVSKSNDTYYAYDNVLYENVEEFDESGDKISATIALIPKSKNGGNIILPTNINGNSLYFGGLLDKTFVIQKDFDKLVEFCDASSGFSIEYIVEEGNTTYETYDGSLYKKGLEKMIAFKNYKDKTIMFSAELKDFGEQCLYDIVEVLSENKEYKIQIDEKNPYFIIKDDLIYNQDGTKLLMPAKYMKTIKVEEYVKEVSEPILRYYDGDLEVSEKNPYLMIDENGELKKKI